jgi:hypothetical protein
MNISTREVIKSIRGTPLNERTNKDEMLYEYYDLVGNISVICVEFDKTHIVPERAVQLIREMIGKCWDSLDGVEHVKSKV